MAQVDHIDDIAFSSSFETDKLYPIKPSGSLAVSATTRSTATVSQPYGANILAVMQYSMDQSVWIDAGAAIYDAAGGTDYQATCYTTSTDLVIVAENYTGSGVTFYYRVVYVLED